MEKMRMEGEKRKKRKRTLCTLLFQRLFADKSPVSLSPSLSPNRCFPPRLLITFCFLHTLDGKSGSTGQLCDRSTPRQVRVPLFGKNRLVLYGKSKKSTHGHQTTGPFRHAFSQPGLR